MIYAQNIPLRPVISVSFSSDVFVPCDNLLNFLTSLWSNVALSPWFEWLNLPSGGVLEWLANTLSFVFLSLRKMIIYTFVKNSVTNNREPCVSKANKREITLKILFSEKEYTGMNTTQSRIEMEEQTKMLFVSLKPDGSFRSLMA